MACLPNPCKLSILGDIWRATILPFSSSKYSYSWLRLSNLVDLPFKCLSFSNKRKTTIVFSSPLTFLQLPIAIRHSNENRSMLYRGKLKSLWVSCQMYRNRKTIMTPWKNPIKTLKEKHWPHRNYNTSNLNKAIGNDLLSSTKQREALVLPPMNSTMPPAWSSWYPNQYMTVPVRRLTRKYGMSADMHVKKYIIHLYRRQGNIRVEF